MADDDEIDVLGDFSLDNFLTKNDSEIYTNTELVSHNSEILNCDCSSQWFLEQESSSNSCWYNAHSDICSDLGQEQSPNVDNRVNNQILTDNISDESGWTKKEKNLLKEGIEIFGKSNARLSQFIGTKSTADVKYYLKHFYVDISSPAMHSNNEQSVIEETIVTSDNIIDISGENEVLNDFEIPASIEEVIAVVSTAKPTIPVNKKKIRKNSNIVKYELNSKNAQNGQSVLKRNVYKQFRRYDNCKKNNTQKQIKNGSIKLGRKRKKDEVKFKFRTKLKASDSSKMNLIAKPPIDNAHLFQNIHSVNGEEVVKILKESSDEEIDLDVENDDNPKENIMKINEDVINMPVIKEEKLNEETGTKLENDSEENLSNLINADVVLNLDSNIMKELISMDLPTSEVILNKAEITDLEKYIHGEFFSGRPTKTPDRYLKIRNYIINAWIISKPFYVTKTSVRHGLKNCGDVNCIGRIHYYLEQIGAINFGCAQTNYVRPLHDMMLTGIPVTKEKVVKDKSLIIKPMTLSRQRNKKKFTHDGEGGCTLTHNENGEVINTIIVTEEPVVKQKPHIKTPTVQLIYCKSFTEDNPKKFYIDLHLQALLLMDLHAHTSLSEVMGLIGGYWNSQNKTLTIIQYVPCRNIASSATHCDMCPISQAKAADIIHNEGLNILGWFHSHPTFAPEPSQQDLDTQLAVQQWIGNNKPCIGLILSPFSAHGALIASPYRCLVVAKKPNFEDQFVPYKINVTLISTNLDVNDLLKRVSHIFKDSATYHVNFKDPYFLDQSITFFEKFICSVKMHLAKCSNLNKMECDKITQGFATICYNST